MSRFESSPDVVSCVHSPLYIFYHMVQNDNAFMSPYILSHSPQSIFALSCVYMHVYKWWYCHTWWTPALTPRVEQTESICWCNVFEPKRIWWCVCVCEWSTKIYWNRMHGAQAESCVMVFNAHRLLEVGSQTCPLLIHGPHEWSAEV